MLYLLITIAKNNTRKSIIIFAFVPLQKVIQGMLYLLIAIAKIIQGIIAIAKNNTRMSILIFAFVPLQK
jgi:hypothetical protein